MKHAEADALAERLTHALWELGRNGDLDVCRIEFRHRYPGGRERAMGGMCRSAMVNFLAECLIEYDDGGAQ